MTAIPIRALIVEDNEDDVVLLLNTLRKSGFEPDSQRVETKPALEEALRSPWDIVFSDFTMPSFNGHEALELVRRADPDIPFFFVSGTIGEDRAVEAMRLGAQDYFIKGNLKRLSPAIHRELRDSLARREHRVAQERIHYLANYDALTGLPNRVQFYERLAQCLHSGASTHIAVFSINLKRFRDVNDHLGNAVGDTLLIETGQRLRAVLHNDDVLARLAADEFAIFSQQCLDEAGVTRLAETILAVFSSPFSLSRYEWRIQAKVGISVYPRDAEASHALCANAAIALHHAQQQIGSSYQFYQPHMRTTLQDKLALLRALETALENRQFELHYQPQVACADGRLIGVEALLRWRHPENGFVSPMEFIPLAEESGLIVPIGAWVLRESCRQIQQWRSQGLTDIRVAVNFSAFQFRQSNVTAMVANVLSEFHLPAHCLEVEITETALMQDASSALQVLNELHDLGVSIALDDFGTGYSSLSYLKRFPVDVLKIDRAFVNDLPDDKDDGAIVHAIIAIAEKLQMDVVAEGVETLAQQEFLQRAGCDLLQGYFIQRPVPAAEILHFHQSSLNGH
ncbi:MAG TPA: EAL domain-containing protein [Spongiibacteraceae bacterium]